MIPPQLLIGGAAAAIVMGFLGGWTVRDWKADSAALAAAKAKEQMRDKMQAKVDAGSTRYEEWRASQEPGRVETRNTIREIFRNAPPVPAQCAAPDAFVGVLDNQTGRANAATLGQSGATVPAATEAAATAN